LRDWHLRLLYLPRNMTLTYNLAPWFYYSDNIWQHEYKLHNSSLYSFLQPPVPPSLLHPKILLSALFPNTLSLCSSLNVSKGTCRSLSLCTITQNENSFSMKSSSPPPNPQAVGPSLVWPSGDFLLNIYADRHEIFSGEKPCEVWCSHTTFQRSTVSVSTIRGSADKCSILEIQHVHAKIIALGPHGKNRDTLWNVAC
jgi:hypothetical protein